MVVMYDKNALESFCGVNVICTNLALIAIANRQKFLLNA